MPLNRFFSVSALFIAPCIDPWFSAQVDRALEASGENRDSA